MKTSLRAFLPLVAALALAACDGEDGGNSISGTFDGDEVDGPVDATAILDNQFLDVILTTQIRVADPKDGSELRLTISVDLSREIRLGEPLPVGTGGAVSATVVRADQPQRSGAGTVQFDVLDAEPGGTVAGDFDLSFNAARLRGSFYTTVE